MLADLADAYGIPADEKAAIELLPSRMRDVYPVAWGASVFDNLRRQTEVAQQVGLIKAQPSQVPWVDLGGSA